MDKTLKEIVEGSAEAAIGEPNSQIGCGCFIIIMGLFFLFVQMEGGEKKPLILVILSIVFIIIGIAIIAHRIISIKKKDKEE